MTVSQEQFDALVERIEQITSPGWVPPSQQLWTPADVANYLGVSKRTVAERYAARLDFPAAIRLPSDSGHGLLRWKAGDVMRWVERQKR